MFMCWKTMNLSEPNKLVKNENMENGEEAEIQKSETYDTKQLHKHNYNLLHPMTTPRRL